MNEDTKQILEIVTDIQDNMVTKQELASELSQTERRLKAQINENTKAIRDLSEAVQGQAGFAKEIDMLMSRMAIVERHLGIESNIPA